MDRAEQAAAHDANFVAGIVLLAELAPAGSVRRFGPLTAAVTGVPGAFFNATWLLEPPAPTEVRAAVDHLRATGLPFVVHARADLPATSSAVEGLGLTEEGRLPCFALEPCPIPPAPAELDIRRVAAADWETFLEVTCAGFGLPREMADQLFAPAMLDRSDVRAYLGRVDGRPVGVSVAVRTGDTLGVYNIATVPDARGHGYGTALTWRLMRDADPGWQLAVLQASEMGRPVYEKMGFRLVREFIEHVGQR